MSTLIGERYSNMYYHRPIIKKSFEIEIEKLENIIKDASLTIEAQIAGYAFSFEEILTAKNDIRFCSERIKNIKCEYAEYFI